MSFIPAQILSKLFNRTSLRNCGDKVCFSVKNRLGEEVVRAEIRMYVSPQPPGRAPI